MSENIIICNRIAHSGKNMVENLFKIMVECLHKLLQSLFFKSVTEKIRLNNNYFSICAQELESIEVN